MRTILLPLRPKQKMGVENRLHHTSGSATSKRSVPRFGGSGTKTKIMSQPVCQSCKLIARVCDSKVELQIEMVRKHASFGYCMNTIEDQTALSCAMPFQSFQYCSLTPLQLSTSCLANHLQLASTSRNNAATQLRRTFGQVQHKAVVT